jgi:AcrR family transcriptional regulator
MPARARTSLDAIIRSARELLEEDGLDAVVMTAVAKRVGVRAPSLYKHVADRAALVRAVGDQVTSDLRAALDRSMTTGDPEADLRSLAHAYRAFVHANPNGYGLLVGHVTPDLQPDAAAVADIGRPIVAAVARLVGEGGPAPLEAGRTFVAWAHGFVSMELAGTFRLGGDLDLAYASGIDLIIAGARSGGIGSAG